MKKTDAILQHLASLDAGVAERTSEIAAAIGEVDGAKNVGALLCYLKTKGRVRAQPSDNGENAWSITAAGRKWFEELMEEAGEAPAPIIRESTRAKAAKARRERVADPEPPAPAPPKKMNGHRQEWLSVPIEVGIPVPVRTLETRWQTLAEAMPPGSSVLLRSQYEATALGRALRRNKHETTQRKLADGFRVWRTK